MTQGSTHITSTQADYAILIDEQFLPSHVRVLEMEVENEINRIPYARLVFSEGSAANPQEENANRTSSLFQLGQQISISFTAEADEAPIFTGIITQYNLDIQEGLARIELECRHKAYRMTLRPQNRTYPSMTDQEVIEQLGELYQLQLEIADISHQHENLIQRYCSDWDFLMMRTEANGMLVSFDHEQLNIAPPDFHNSGEEPEVISYEGQVISFRGQIDVEHQFEQVIYRNWEPERLNDEEGDEADPVGSDDDSVLGLPEEEGERNVDLEAINHPDHDGQGSSAQLSNHQILHSGTPLPTPELQARANARQLRNRLSQKRGHLRIRNHLSVRPGQVINLQGFGRDFQGLVFVSQTEYFFKDGLWLMDIHFGLNPVEHTERFPTEMPKVGGVLSAIHGLHIGVVLQIDQDPNNAFRVLVNIPVMAEDAGSSGSGQDNDAQAGIWARIATLDAGISQAQQDDPNNPGRGTFFLPEVGDEVILGFIDEDPRYPVILGMLYSAARPPAEEFSSPSEANPLKGFVSRDGLKLLFQEDDETKAIILETSEDNRLTISETDDEGGFELSDKHGNRILMSSEGILIESAAKLSLKAEQDIEQEATAKWTAKGAQGKLEINGTLDISGGIVNIN